MIREVASSTFAVLFCLTIQAMPYAFELKNAKPIVNSLIGDYVAQAEGGKADRAEIADRIRNLVGKTNNNAEKYILLTESFRQYAMAMAFDQAAEVIDELYEKFDDIPAHEIINLIERNSRQLKRARDSRLYKQLETAKTKEKCVKLAKDAEKTLKKQSFDSVNRRIAAESYAVIGDWDKALHHFVKTRGQSSDMAIAELNGKDCWMDIADFWWKYDSQDCVGKTDSFKLHGAQIYRRLIEENRLKGLEKTLASTRIEELEAKGVKVTAQVLVSKHKEPAAKVKTTALAHAHPGWTDEPMKLKVDMKGTSDINILRFKAKVPVGATGVLCSLIDSAKSYIYINLDGKGKCTVETFDYNGKTINDNWLDCDIVGEHEFCMYYNPNGGTDFYVDGKQMLRSQRMRYRLYNTAEFCVGMRNDGKMGVTSCKFKDAEVFIGKEAEKVAACFKR